MLETLKIKNIAVIDQAEIPFRPGLNILSGETGAGKSIVIEAISLLLGSRASSELIRSGSDEAVIEGLFDITDIPWVRTRLQAQGFDPETDELLIKRSVSRAGKHRIYINGELATLSILQTICEGLIDLCGQHEHQSLIKAQTQLELLDRYGNLTELAKQVSVLFFKTRDLEKQYLALQTQESERVKRMDYLNFQIKELVEASLVEGEDAKLQAEKQLLQSGESRVQCAEAIREMLEEDETGAINALRGALMKARALRQLDERVEPIWQGLERALAESEEVSIALGRYLSSVDLDPERLQMVQERLALIADLKRKYGGSVNEILSTQAKLEQELTTIGKSEERMGALLVELKNSQNELTRLGKKLSSSRKKSAELLATSVTGELKDLKMSGAKFSVQLQSKEELSEWTSAGGDFIQFMVQTNIGEESKPLGKIASGGELSRLMLAIRRVIADQGGIGVYLFDEIDAGIGGQTAFQVGKKLKSVASYNQVICITHLPQVASFADHHLIVRKKTTAKRTLTEIAELSQRERKEELARMLGGPELTKKSLENAAELLELAK